MAISPVQNVYNYSSTAPLAVTLATSGGHSLIAVGRYYVSAAPAGFPASITDTAGNTWHFSTGAASNPPAVTLPGAYSGNFAAWTLGAGAVSSVTFSTNNDADVGYIEVNVSEWSGIAAEVTGGTNTGTSGDVLGPSLPVSAGSLILGGCEAGTGTPSLPSGATALSASGSSTDWFVYQIPATSGTIQWDWVDAGATFSTVAAVFSPGVLGDFFPFF